MKKFPLYGGIVLFCVATGLGAYARIWEHRQPIQKIEDAFVTKIKPYSATNDLHWSFRGYRLFVEGEHRLIDFSSGNFNTDVSVGEHVDMTVRRSFPLFVNELDGLSIYRSR